MRLPHGVVITFVLLLTIFLHCTPPANSLNIHSPPHRRLPPTRSRNRLSTSAAASDTPPSDSAAASKSPPSSLPRNFLNIALPAFIQQTSEPLASLVDTAYLGRLPPHVLGGAGVGVSASYICGKLFNDPLLRSSISLVSAAAASDVDGGGSSASSSAISTAVLLAAAVGLAQLLFYVLFANRIIAGMGVASSSPMLASALGYLKIRALGSPASTLWLVVNGVYRGLGDTKSPLVWSLVFTALNCALDWLFIFPLGMGARGAALGTIIAQYVALIPLLYKLNEKYPLVEGFERSRFLESLRTYLKAGGHVMLRTVAKVSAYAMCSRKAALLGPTPAAAYQLTFQLGFATTQVCEAGAVATQSLLAGAVATKDKDRCRGVVRLGLGWGFLAAGVLSAATFLGRTRVIDSLSTSPGVRSACGAVFPAVLLCQVLKGGAYATNGCVLGALDWGFSNLVMWMSNFAIVAFLWGGEVTLGRLWWGLSLFMGVQVVASLGRVLSGTGPFRVLRESRGP